MDVGSGRGREIVGLVGTERRVYAAKWKTLQEDQPNGVAVVTRNLVPSVLRLVTAMTS